MSLPQQKANYLAKAIGACFGLVESSGNYQIAVQCEIVDHPDFAGETIAWIGTFAAGKATDITIEALQNFGWKGDDLAELADLDAAACEKLLPDVVSLACELDEYNGDVTLKAKWVNKPGAGRFAFKKPLSGADLKAFAAQMRGTIRGAQQGGGSRASNSSSRPTQPTGAGNGSSSRQTGQARHPNAPDDDLPF